MKRTLLLLSAMLLFASCALFLGCAGDTAGDDQPLLASQPEASALWDAHPLLDGLPRYSMGGLMNGVTDEDGKTVVSIVGVSAEEYEAYANILLANGLRLQKDSDIWLSEGITGIPVFTFGGRTVSIIWSFTGSLELTAEEG